MKKNVIKENKYFLFDRPYELTLKTVLKKTFRTIQSIYYKILISIACLSIKKKEKKYNVCICAIFKDEGFFLKEWLEYHLIIGIDHFYLYNNNSSDNYQEILNPFIRAGIVTLIDWPHQQAQMEAYQDAIKHFREETKWLGFIDLDEYVVPLEEKNIYDIFKKYERKTPSILIYWKCFGTSGLLKRKDNKLLIEQFSLAEYKIVDIGKCFWNTAFEFADDIKGKNACLHHWCWCRWNNHFIPPVNIWHKVAFDGFNKGSNKKIPIQINHYVTKSYDDYYKKTYVKSDVYFANNPRNIEQLYNIDALCTTPDYSIYRYMIKLKNKMRDE